MQNLQLSQKDTKNFFSLYRGIFVSDKMINQFDIHESSIL
mgnify:CR=1 FL=1